MNFSESITVSPSIGESIYHRDSEASDEHTTPGKVLFLHGLGDHIACHDWAAELVHQAGFVSQGFDWLGHGKSSGHRGDVRGVNSAIRLIDEKIEQMETPPVGVFSHSTGGFILLRYLEDKRQRGEQVPFRWIWLNSPLLHPDFNQSNLKIWMAGQLEKYFPKMSVPTRVRKSQCCHLNGAEKDDARIDFTGCHNRVSLRFGNSLMNHSHDGFASGIPIAGPVRLLLTQGAQDPICPPHFATKFFGKIPASDKTFVLVKGARHEAFREADTRPLFNSVSAWLSAC